MSKKNTRFPMFEKCCSLNIKAMIAIKQCLALFPICPDRFDNLFGYDRSFSHVEMGDFLPKAPFEDVQEPVNSFHVHVHLFIHSSPSKSVSEDNRLTGGRAKKLAIINNM